MKEELISFKTAKLAKEKGCRLTAFTNMYNQDGNFDSPYKETYPSYSQSLLQRWLREVHNIDVDVWCNASGWGYDLNKTCGTSIYLFELETDTDSGMYETYEQALEAGLRETLKLIK